MFFIQVLLGMFLGFDHFLQPFVILMYLFNVLSLSSQIKLNFERFPYVLNCANLCFFLRAGSWITVLT